jgi:hypothetical protein
MTWFGSHRRTGSWLALLALALQLALSFGHVHVGAASPVAVAAAAIDTDRQTPSGDKHDDYCAICAVLSLLSGAQIATAPAVFLPVLIAAAELPSTTEAVRIAATHTAFRSRAPPIS